MLGSAANPRQQDELRHFPNYRGLLKFIECGFFLRKNPLEFVVSINFNSENASVGQRLPPSIAAPAFG